MVKKKVNRKKTNKKNKKKLDKREILLIVLILFLILIWSAVIYLEYHKPEPEEDAMSKILKTLTAPVEEGVDSEIDRPLEDVINSLTAPE